MPQQQMQAVLEAGGFGAHGLTRDISAAATYSRDSDPSEATVSGPDGGRYSLRTSWGNTIVITFPDGSKEFLMEHTDASAKSNEQVLQFLRKWIPVNGLEKGPELDFICDVSEEFPRIDARSDFVKMTVKGPYGSMYTLRASWYDSVIIIFPDGARVVQSNIDSDKKTNVQVLEFLRDKWIPRHGLTRLDLDDICDDDEEFPDIDDDSDDDYDDDDNPAEDPDDVAGSGCGGAGSGKK